MGKYTVEKFDEDQFTVFGPDGKVIVRNVSTLGRAKAIIQNHRKYWATQKGPGTVVWEEEA